MAVIVLYTFGESYIATAYAETIQTVFFPSDEYDIVTPEMFGAQGDGISDDTEALQIAFECGSPVLLLPKTYRTTSTLIIKGNISILDAGSTIRYEGKDSAICFMGINNHCDVSFGSIIAKNGNGVEFYCDTRNTRCQYINFSFNIISAGNICIYFNRAVAGDPMETGWLNEIRLSNGRLMGKYGVYADAKGNDAINNIKFSNVTFEGVKTGAYMANACRAWSFINTRIVEMTKDDQCAFQTAGKVEGLTIFLEDTLKLNKYLFSDYTQGIIIAPLEGRDSFGNALIVGNLGEIIDGKLIVYNQNTASLIRFQNINDGNDLNMILIPGNYCFPEKQGSEGLINCPTDASFVMRVSYADGSPNYILQEIKEYDSNNVFSRTYSMYTDSFSPWKRNATEDDIFNLQQEITNLRNMIEQLQ